MQELLPMYYYPSRYSTIRYVLDKLSRNPDEKQLELKKKCWARSSMDGYNNYLQLTTYFSGCACCAYTACFLGFPQFVLFFRYNKSCCRNLTSFCVAFLYIDRETDRQNDAHVLGVRLLLPT